jgi:dTDP-4-amino-4,6-dideoxygalactose transaminase
MREITAGKARTVPFNALAPGIQTIRADLDAAIARVLEHGYLILGPESETFEQAFAAYHGPGLQAVGLGSGTDALRIGLEALGVEPGDEVLVVANAGVPPVAAVVAARARPVFCDVDPDTHVLDPSEIERRTTPRTRAVLVVHLYGCPAEMDTILEYAKARGLRVLEDCAQAHGARYRGRIVGTLGHGAAFSFYPTKNLGALGDGGALLTADPEVADRARLLRQYGWRQKYFSEVHSTNTRLDDLQAAILAAKLPHLDSWNATRRQLAALYRECLAEASKHVRLPVESSSPRPSATSTHVYHLYVLRVAERNSLRAYLAERGVGTDVHYPLPAHLQAPYAPYGKGPGSLPHTEQLAREVLSLPMYPELSPHDVCYVAEQVCEWANARRTRGDGS